MSSYATMMAILHAGAITLRIDGPSLYGEVCRFAIGVVRARNRWRDRAKEAMAEAEQYRLVLSQCSANLHNATSERNEALAKLKSIEWRGSTSWREDEPDAVCPSCRARRKQGHDDDCEVYGGAA